MLKKTLLFEKKTAIHFKLNQLNIKTDEVERRIPVEDVGFVVLDHPEIYISLTAMNALVENGSAVIICNKSHLPNGMFMSLNSHHIQQEIFRHQMNASEALKKQLWQQVVKEKIRNQGLLLAKITGKTNSFDFLASKVLSGDKSNMEGVAASQYWKNLPLGSSEEGIKRERFGAYPNNFLNYGYAILRAAVARALSGSGLLNTLGVHHRNKYNAYALADDIMEPFRPMVDEKVYEMMQNDDEQELNTKLKAELLQILTQTVYFDDEKSPLMVGLQRTTSALQQCYTGERKKIIYPKLWN